MPAGTPCGAPDRRPDADQATIPADERRRRVIHVHLPIVLAVQGYILAGRRRRPLPRAVRGSGTCAHQRSSRADYDRTIFMAVLAIIAIVLKTNRDAYENDQLSRSERS